MALFKFYHIVRGNSSNGVVVASNLPATIKECYQFLLERLEMSGNKEGHDRGGPTEVSVGHVLLSEGDEVLQPGLLGGPGGLTDQGGVNVHPQARHTVASGRGEVDAAHATAQIYQIVGGAHTQTGQDQIYGSLNREHIIITVLDKYLGSRVIGQGQVGSG